jgi:hypothetical protein
MKLGAALAVGLGLAAAVAAARPAAAETPRPPACTVEALQGIAGSAARILSARRVDAGAQTPAYCAVSGSVEHGTSIGFILGLPDAWNRKFLFYGIGGFAGMPTPIDVFPFNKGLKSGYATGSTDTGHKGTLEDATWALNNPAGVLNHYEDGVELSARAMKGLIGAYYGLAPEHAYFEGCSAGGRQAMVEAERFPTTFDGVIAEAPAWNYSRLLSTFALNAKEILRSPGAWIPPSAFVRIDRLVLEQCDEVDGVKDGIVIDPRRCRLDLKPLLCRPGEAAESCLSKEQLTTLDRIVHPPYAKGRPGYFGFQLTGTDRSEGWWGWPEWMFGTVHPVPDAGGRLNFAGDVLPPGPARGVGPNQFLLGEQFFRYMVMNDPAYDARSFDLERDYARLQARLGGVIDADATDLGGFVRAGGKLIIWHGWADNAIPPEMSIDLYERVRRDTRDRPGQSPLDQSARLFMVPGVQHCGSGSGLVWFDALPALEAWVEGGKAPERITAAQIVDAKPGRSRPLCPYPKAAVYSGKGDPDDQASFDCR